MAKLGFNGGAKLQARLEELAGAVARGKTVNVGFLEHATYPNGSPVAFVAAVNEFGNPAHNQPPRPFFRTMIEQKAKSWGPMAGKILIKCDFDSERALGLMGEVIADQLRGSIRTLESPPLAPSTIARKGFDKPLIDTSVMLSSVDYEVKT